MIKILYYIYVGIRSFHPLLPFTKANDLIAIAPLPADLICPLSTTTYTNWLDVVYLNSQARVRNNPSRFTESEDYSPLPDPIPRPRSSGHASTSCPIQNGTVHCSAPGNIVTISRTPTTTDGSRATRGGTATLLLRPTLAIVIKSLFICPPPHYLRSIEIPFKNLIVSRHKKSQKFGSIIQRAIIVLNQIVFRSFFSPQIHTPLHQHSLSWCQMQQHTRPQLSHQTQSIHTPPCHPKYPKNLPGSLHLNRLFRSRSQYIPPRDVIRLTP